MVPSDNNVVCLPLIHLANYSIDDDDNDDGDDGDDDDDDDDDDREEECDECPGQKRETYHHRIFMFFRMRSEGFSFYTFGGLEVDPC